MQPVRYPGPARVTLTRSTSVAEVTGVQGRTGLPGVNAVANDAATAGYIVAAGSATRVALDSVYLPGKVDDVPPAIGAGAVWIDTGNVAPLSYKWKRDTVTATATASFEWALGEAPVLNSEQVYRNGLLLAPSAYTMDGNLVTITSVTSGDVLQFHYAYDGEAPDAATGAKPIIDTFTRTASTTSLGSTDTGQAWTARRGTWGIITGDRAYESALDGGADNHDFAVLDVGVPDYDFDCALSTLASGGLVVRVAASGSGDPDSCIIVLPGAGIYVRTGGVNTLLDGFSTTMTTGDTCRISTRGNTIKVYKQTASVGAFALISTVTSSQNATSTLCGLRNRTSTGARWDSVRIVRR